MTYYNPSNPLVHPSAAQAPNGPRQPASHRPRAFVSPQPFYTPTSTPSSPAGPNVQQPPRRTPYPAAAAYGGSSNDPQPRDPPRTRRFNDEPWPREPPQTQYFNSGPQPRDDGKNGNGRIVRGGGQPNPRPVQPGPGHPRDPGGKR